MTRPPGRPPGVGTRPAWAGRMAVPQVPERRHECAVGPPPRRHVAACGSPALNATGRVSGRGLTLWGRDLPRDRREDRAELAQDASRGAPDRQAVHLVRAVAQRPVADGAL